MGRGLFMTYDELIYYPKKSNKETVHLLINMEFERNVQDVVHYMCKIQVHYLQLFFTCFYERKLHHTRLHKLNASSITLRSDPCT